MTASLAFDRLSPSDWRRHWHLLVRPELARASTPTGYDSRGRLHVHVFAGRSALSTREIRRRIRQALRTAGVPRSPSFHTNASERGQSVAELFQLRTSVVVVVLDGRR